MTERKYDPKRGEVNRALNGQLNRFMRVRRERGDSFDDIAFAIRTQTGVPVTKQTVSEWWSRLVEVG